MTEPVDLGHDHVLRFLGWAPDRDLNPQYEGIPDVERYGAVISHPLHPGDECAACQQRGRCEGALTFNGEVQQQIESGRDCWDVQSWEPLTISPSILCHCGDHGFIQQGRWVPA